MTRIVRHVPPPAPPTNVDGSGLFLVIGGRADTLSAARTGSVLGENDPLEMRLDLSDSAAVGVVDLSNDGTIVAANAAFAHLVGATNPVGSTLDAVLGASTGQGFPVPSHSRLVDVDRPIDVVVVLPNGKRRTLELLPVERTAEGESAGLTVTFIDRSARSEAQAEASRYRAIFEDIGDLIGIMAPDGTVLSMNPSAEEFFGTESLSRGLFQFVPESWSEFLYTSVLPALAAEGRWEGEVGLVRHDGVEVPHYVTLQRHPSDVPFEDYWWAVARDRSMVVKAMQADTLEQLNEAKDRFIAGVSHELRTPLTTIRGFADILASGAAPLEERDEFIGIIQRESHAMSSIVEDLLVAARIDAGRVTVTVEDVDMGVVVGEVLSGLPRTDRQITNHVPRGVMARGDGMRCRQVIRNLVTNALRHGGDHISVEVEASAGRLLLRVVDDGPGVDPDIEDDIFQPYVSRPRNGRRPESVGLGLTVCRQLARLMEGDVVYARTDRTSFTLDLPQAVGRG